MVLVEAFKRVVFQRYADFNRRAGRAEYWWFFLANLVVSVILGLLGRVSVVFTVIYIVYALALLIPGLAVGVRRLHDINRSGWWLLLALIPVVGVIILIVFHATAGDPGPNAYGPLPDPLPA